MFVLCFLDNKRIQEIKKQLITSCEILINPKEKIKIDSSPTIFESVNGNDFEDLANILFNTESNRDLVDHNNLYNQLFDPYSPTSPSSSNTFLHQLPDQALSSEENEISKSLEIGFKLVSPEINLASKNNIASKELRARRKEDAEMLTNKEIEMEQKNKEMRNEVKLLEGEIKGVLSVFTGISEKLIKNNFLQFRENFLNLIHLVNQAINHEYQSGDTAYKTAVAPSRTQPC